MNLYTAYLVLQVIESVLIIFLLVSLLIIIFKANALIRRLVKKVGLWADSLEAKMEAISSKLSLANIFKWRSDG